MGAGAKDSHEIGVRATDSPLSREKDGTIGFDIRKQVFEAHSGSGNAKHRSATSSRWNWNAAARGATCGSG